MYCTAWCVMPKSEKKPVNSVNTLKMWKNSVMIQLVPCIDLTVDIIAFLMWEKHKLVSLHYL